MVSTKQIIGCLLKSLVTLGLLITFSLFFLQDQITAFLKNRSTISSRYEISERLEFPTITLCFDSATKLSVSKKYGFTQVQQKFHEDTIDKSLVEVFDELSYILGRDFHVSFRHGESMKIGEFQIQGLDFGNDSIYTFVGEQIRTYFYGTCTKLQPKFDVTKAPLRFQITVSLSSKLSKEDIPTSMSLYLTSNKTWIGITDSMWPQFKPLHENIDFKREKTSFVIKVGEKYFQHGVADNSKCFEELFRKYDCSPKCKFLDCFQGNLPLCRKADELQCMFRNSYTDPKYIDCYTTRKAITYSLVERSETPIHTDINLTTTTVWVELWTMEKEVQEEVKLLTTEDFIGSVGGSLGMFFGFSIYATLFFCIDKTFNRFR